MAKVELKSKKDLAQQDIQTVNKEITNILAVIG
jgi:hypothetical protein